MKLGSSLRGCVKIQVNSGDGERFLTLCSKAGVFFFQVQALDADCFTAWLSVGDFPALRRCAAKTSSRIRVLEKRGLPFLLRPIARRRALLAGILLSIAVVLWSMGRVWIIRVEGCVETTPKEILQLLERAGLKTGARKAELSARALKNHVIAGCDKLSYLTVNFRGVQALVQVWERKDTPSAVPQEEPCNIVSDKTGVILRLRVRQGTACVQVGDAVRPGDILAEGTLSGANGVLRPVHAMAEAEIRSVYTIRTAVPAELRTLRRWEELRPERYLVLGKDRFSLRKIENTDNLWYDKQIQEQLLPIQEDFHFPVGLETVYRYCCIPSGEAPEQGELGALLERRMLERLAAAKPDAKLCGWTFSLEKTEGGALMGVLNAELIELCGVESPMQQE